MPGVITRLVNVVVPARLGRDFRWLLSSSIVNNTGDGIVLAAGPLLVASQTRDPFVVSLALLFDYLPTLLFGVIAGTAADRFDRRRMVILANVARALDAGVPCRDHCHRQRQRGARPGRDFRFGNRRGDRRWAMLHPSRRPCWTPVRLAFVLASTARRQ